MPRGKKVNIDEYIANIEDFLKIGCSIHDACLQADIPYRTVKDYYDGNEEIRKKIDRLMNYAIVAARKSLVGAVELDPSMALKYLERKCKEEFSTKTESSVDMRSEITINSILEGLDGETSGLPSDDN